jgi:hypothetical protein
MQRLTLFLTSWPVMTLIVAGCAVLLMWPDDAQRVIRALLLAPFLLAYLG